MKQKKVIVIITSVLMLSLMGCGSNNDDTETQVNENNSIAENVENNLDEYGTLNEESEMTSNDFSTEYNINENEENIVDIEENDNIYTIVADEVYDLNDHNFHNGRAWVTVEDESGNCFSAVIDENFQIVYKTSEVLENINPFDEEGYSYYYDVLNEKYIFINQNGDVTYDGKMHLEKMIGKGRFIFSSLVSEGYNHSETMFGIMNEEGEILFESDKENFPIPYAIYYDDVSYCDGVYGINGLFIYRLEAFDPCIGNIFQLDGEIVGTNEEGNIVCHNDYGCDGTIFYKYDNAGNIVSQTLIDLPEHRSTADYKYLADDCVIRLGENPYLIKLDGTIISDFSDLGADIIIDDVSDVSNGYFAILLKGVGGSINHGAEYDYLAILDITGNVILPPVKTYSYDMYTQAEYSDGLLKVFSETDTEFYDITGKCVFKVPTHDIAGFSEGYVYLDGGFYDVNGNFINQVREK